MALEILTYSESRIEDLVGVFNRETEPDAFVVPLTPDLFQSQIASKPYFSPDGCFLAVQSGKPVGFALTSPGISSRNGGVNSGVGVVDGLFFPEGRLDIGDALLDACMAYFRSLGEVETVYGFASYGGYPYWRGIYCGSEPVCLTRYAHAWVTFMAHGFTHHQQSLNYLGTPVPCEFRSDLTYRERDLDLPEGWARQSWKGHTPRVILAEQAGHTVGRIGYVDMSYLSEYRQKPISGIYSMSVDPQFRRQGIATSLITYLFTHASERGTEEILVGTTVDNTAARRTYEGVGMAPIAFRTGTMYRRLEGQG